MRVATGLPEISFLGAMPKRTWPSCFALATTSSRVKAIPLTGAVTAIAAPKRVATAHLPNCGIVVPFRSILDLLTVNWSSGTTQFFCGGRGIKDVYCIKTDMSMKGQELPCRAKSKTNSLTSPTVGLATRGERFGPRRVIRAPDLVYRAVLLSVNHRAQVFYHLIPQLGSLHGVSHGGTHETKFI